MTTDQAWRSMDSAPTDEPILLRVPRKKPFLAHLIPVEGEDGTCWAWAEASEAGGAPKDWCDGICWASNSEGKPSTQPTGWKPAREG